ncbi:sulfotransferase family protein [Mesorhizobium sp. J18]|uniref:sulfotransferase n=1 Tax=Mesorhizobium sp. J18 TaxID=935263 RepID=UPI00119BE8FE|nr:sulfotransferase [Mesorhizobium sp. J18]TWH00587.1 sulfotransferase family protein [Mesorhizobium sp. J18]
MTGTESTAKAGESPAGLEVDAWTDRFGRLLERHRGFWVRVGNWETRLLEDQLDGVVIDRPIYIAGLARSGSTILLEMLARHSDTATHRYRDFPIVPAPWAWSWFVDRAGKKEHVLAERAHRDRIKVSPESPEAFEEVLWMTFFPGLHDGSWNAALDEHTDNPEFEVFYRDHIRKMLRLRGASRYLAKGNYNVTRLRYLRELFPDARFVIPIRDPVWHIASLVKQHRLFVAEEKADARVRDHMRRSGHFEFGLDRQPINVGGAERVAEIRELWSKGEEAAGYAELWALVYGHVADMLDQGPALADATLVIRYEDLCRSPVRGLSDVLDHCALEDQGLLAAARDEISPPDYYEPSFTEAEREDIRSRTAEVAARFGYG